MKKYLYILFVLLSVCSFGSSGSVSTTTFRVEKEHRFQIETSKTFNIYNECAHEIKSKMFRDEEITFDIYNFIDDFLDIRVLNSNLKMDLTLANEKKNQQKLKSLKENLIYYKENLNI